MKVKLEKWYLDFTSQEETGFYYIMCLTFGRFRIGFTGINHFDSSRSIQSFKFLRTKRLSFHELILSKAQLTTNLHTAQIQIDHGKTAIKGIRSALRRCENRAKLSKTTASSGIFNSLRIEIFVDM